MTFYCRLVTSWCVVMMNWAVSSRFLLFANYCLWFKEVYVCRWCKYIGKITVVQRHQQLLYVTLQFDVEIGTLKNYRCYFPVHESVDIITVHNREMAHSKQINQCDLAKKQETRSFLNTKKTRYNIYYHLQQGISVHSVCSYSVDTYML